MCLLRDQDTVLCCSSASHCQLSCPHLLGRWRGRARPLHAKNHAVWKTVCHGLSARGLGYKMMESQFLFLRGPQQSEIRSFFVLTLPYLSLHYHGSSTCTHLHFHASFWWAATLLLSQFPVSPSVQLQILCLKPNHYTQFFTIASSVAVKITLAAGSPRIPFLAQLVLNKARSLLHQVPVQ